MRNKWKDVLFIMILGSICVALLAGIKKYTYPIVEANKKRKIETTILGAAAIDYTDKNFEEVFRGKIRKAEKGGFVYYLAPGGLYLFEFRGRGLWGMIEGLVTFNEDLETIENIRIISQEETPGLGARITEPAFLQQFVKKKASPRLNLVLRSKAVRNNEVDAISGASMTSAALIGMINSRIEEFCKVMKGDETD